MDERIFERIERGRERWDVLRHPFYRRWTEGELTVDELARYSGQYRRAVEAIASLSGALAEALPGHAELRRHAAEELGHVRLWDGFVEACGGGDRAAATPETRECVRAWAGEGEALELAARLYAIESGQPEIARIKREGLVDRYGFDDGPATAYFTLHQTRDLAHAGEARELIGELAEPQDTDRVAAAAESAFRANWRLLDGVG